jgi:hypothetical protein
MHKLCTFHIQVRGRVQERTLNAHSPLHMKVVPGDADRDDALESTTVAICADQSGLIGLIRHLHGHGFLILSVCRNLDALPEEET